MSQQAAMPDFRGDKQSKSVDFKTSLENNHDQC